MKPFVSLFLLGTLLLQPISVVMVEGQPQPAPLELRTRAPARNPVFATPAALRDRVNFWISIYSRYTEYQSVIHHRWYPQAVYTVLDFSDVASEMSDVQLEKHRRRVFDAMVKEMHAALKVLATGAMPSTAVERRVAEWIAKVPGGPEKYLEVIKEDLIRSQRGIKDKHAEAIVRSGRYLPILERIFTKEYGLPVELTRLPFVESSFDYKAYSSVGAAGIWQFMPATGRIYLTVNRQIDERRDPIEATHAAAKYLRAAYNRIQDWPLALTSYNHGVAGVVSKVKKLGTNDIAEIVERPPERLFGFASSNFYPCFLAALEIYEQRERYFRNAQPAPVLRLAMTEMQSAVSVRYVTQTLGVPEDELRRLNYAISEQVWQGRAKIPAGYVLKVPQEYATKLGMLRIPETSPRVTEASSASSVYGGTIYKVRKGDTLGSIAKKYQTTPEKIRELNELGSSTIRIGQTLVVKPKHLESKPAHPGAERVAKEPARRESAPASTSSAKTPVVKYKVRSGDSWWRIAKTNRTTVDQLLTLNPTLGRTLRPGMLVRVR